MAETLDYQAPPRRRSRMGAAAAGISYGTGLLALVLLSADGMLNLMGGAMIALYLAGAALGAVGATLEYAHLGLGGAVLHVVAAIFWFFMGGLSYFGGT